MQQILRSDSWRGLILVPAAMLLFAGPALAQGTALELGFKLRSHARGERSWRSNPTKLTGEGTLGIKGSRVPLDGISIRHSDFEATYQVYAGGAWLSQVNAPARTGIQGKPIEAIRVEADSGTVQYRVVPVGGPPGPWAENGAPAGTPGSGTGFEMIEVQYRYAGRTGATFLYRVLFKGKTEFTPWAKAGEILESGNDDVPLTALEIKSTVGDVGWEFTFVRGLAVAVREGSPAGDTKGRYGIGLLRMFGMTNPIDCRAKLPRSGWTDWAQNGVDCGSPHASEGIVGLHLRVATGE
jgi:hypothetical protein